MFDLGQTVIYNQLNQLPIQKFFDFSNNFNIFYTDQLYNNNNNYTIYTICLSDNYFNKLNKIYYTDQSDQFTDNPHIFSILIEYITPVNNIVTDIPKQIKNSVTIAVICFNYYKNFILNNNFYRYLFCTVIVNRDKSTIFFRNTIIVELSNTDKQFIVKSDRSDNILLSIGFCFWKTITVNIGLNTTIFYY